MPNPTPKPKPAQTIDLSAGIEDAPPQIDLSADIKNPYPQIDLSAGIEDNNPPYQMPETPDQWTLPQAIEHGKNVAVGALKGAGHTLRDIQQMELKYIPGLSRVLQPTFTEQQVTPHGTAQTLGQGAEQVGEFFIPGIGEEGRTAELAGKLPLLGRFARPVSRMALGATDAGAVNAAQGRGFGSGALLGATGGLATEAGKMAAPRLAEWSMGINTPGAKTGRAILDETHAWSPGLVRRSARNVLNRLNPEMEGLVDQASLRPSTVPIGPQLEPNPSVSLRPARQVAAESVGKTAGGTNALAPAGRNEPKMAKGVARMGRIVTHDLAGNPLSEYQTPRQVLELRRGVDTALPKGSFHPESTNAFKGYRTPLRNALNESIGEQVPGYRDLARRESALIPATEPPQRGFGHLWGPGAGMLFGGYYGARGGARNGGGAIGALQGGIMGAGEGALAGTVLPGALNATARTLNSGVMPRALVGLAAQATPKKEIKETRK